MKKNKFLKAVLLCLSIILCLGIFVGCGESEDEKKEDKYKIYTTAQLYVKDRLKSPDTAKFADTNEAEIIKIGEHEYKVKSYVTSENSFGANVKSTFSCKIKIDHENKTTKCDDMEITP
ncbi:hypothetical protein ACXAT3_002688 [Clostridium sporogenes]